MTKEELKQEAEEKCVCTDEAMRIMYGIGYIDGAEPREKRITELEKENRLLGERCTQLLKDKGDLTDELQELKETLAQTIENDEVAYETLKLHNQEEIGMLNSKITKLEQQIEKMKCPWNCRKFGHCKYTNCPCDKWEIEKCQSQKQH